MTNNNGPTGGVTVPGVSRRTVLAAVAVVGAATAVGGCSSGADTGASSGPVTVPVADVPVGGGKILPDSRVVVTQPTAGTYKAFSAVCTHQGCLVGSVADGVISCPCHQSRFSATDGSVRNGPAPSPLPARTVTVNGSTLTVS
jgi:Rieske Fe-S protein